MPTRKYKQDAFKDKLKNDMVRYVIDTHKIASYIKRYINRSEPRLWFSPDRYNTILPLTPNYNNVWYYLTTLYGTNNRIIKFIEKDFNKNTYGILDELIRLFKELIDAPFKNIAINKIKRNAIYNHGLGLKLAVREYSKDF
jgi:hypothetical protein